jgi:hypothetical protein
LARTGKLLSAISVDAAQITKIANAIENDNELLPYQIADFKARTARANAMIPYVEEQIAYMKQQGMESEADAAEKKMLAPLKAALLKSQAAENYASAEAKKKDAKAASALYDTGQQALAAANALGKNYVVEQVASGKWRVKPQTPNIWGMVDEEPTTQPKPAPQRKPDPLGLR